jgi:hypothetical protein
MTQRRNRRSGVEDRWSKTVRLPDGTTETVPSAVHGTGKRWRARYVDEEGREHAKGFARKTDAQSWLDTEITAAFATGTYVDPKRGKITFASFYKEWSTRQVWESSTRHVMDQAGPLGHLRRRRPGGVAPLAPGGVGEVHAGRRRWSRRQSELGSPTPAV